MAAEQAKQALPQSHARIGKALQIVLSGNVELLSKSTAKVINQRDSRTVYHIVNDTCDCPDVAKAPQGYCKHILSVFIARRARELAQQKRQALGGQHHERSQTHHAPDQPAASPPTAVSKARVSVHFRTHVHGIEVQFTMQDHDEAALLPRLDWLLTQVQIRQHLLQTWTDRENRA